MSKRNLLNLGLLALIGVLVALALYEPGIEKPEQLVTLVQLDKEAISRITIQRDGQQDVALAKGDKGPWRMEQPVHHAADSYRIDSLLRIATIKSLSSFAAAEDKLTAYQLDKPRVTLTLNDDITIAFGGSTPLDQRRYVLLNGRVHLITDTLYYHLIGSFPTFLRKQLLDEGSGIDALNVPGLEVKWQENRWQLTPEPEGFSADQVSQLVDHWKLASALEIRPYDNQPGERVSIRLAGTERPLELLLTARQPDLILARPELGVQYHLDASAAERLLQLPQMTDETGDQMDGASEEQGEKTTEHHDH